MESFKIKIELEDDTQFTAQTDPAIHAETSVEHKHDPGSEETLQIEFKTEIDIEPTIVGEPKKLFDTQRLREFGDVPFVIKRMEPQDFSISYRKAVSSVETILERLRRNGVPTGTGIAFRIANHTPSSCILILA